MTSVCFAFIAYDKIGLGLSFDYSAIIGVVSAIVALIAFLASKKAFLAKPIPEYQTASPK